MQFASMGLEVNIRDSGRSASLRSSTAMKSRQVEFAESRANTSADLQFNAIFIDIDDVIHLDLVSRSPLVAVAASTSLSKLRYK
jgi:hypothetical protein